MADDIADTLRNTGQGIKNVSQGAVDLAGKIAQPVINAVKPVTDYVGWTTPTPPKITPVPRAKGGPVMKGGAPMMKNVDNSGLKKEPC